MSLKKEKLVDVRIDGGATTHATHYGTVGTASNVRQTYMPASASTSAIDFTITTPSQSTYVSRRFDINGSIPFKFTVYNYGTDVHQITPGVDIGVEAFPFNSIINNATVQINTSNFTTQQQQILPLLKRKLRAKEMRDLVAGTPAQLSQMDILTRPGLLPFHNGPFDAAGGDEDCVQNGGSGIGISPIGSQLNSGWSVPGANAVTGAPGVNTLYGYLRVSGEPLLMEPFDVNDDQPGMVNVNVINVRLNLSALDDQYARPLRFALPDWVSVAGQPIAPTTMVPRLQYTGLQYSFAGDGPMTANLSDGLTLSVTYLSPPFAAGSPKQSIYPYTHYNPLTTQFSTPTSSPIAPFGNFQVTSNVITLNVCPDALALYFIPTLPDVGSGFNTNDNSSLNTTYNPGVPLGSGYCREDVMFFPDAISITWNNNATLLNTLDSVELVRRTLRNGIPGATRNRSVLTYQMSATNVAPPGPAMAPWRGTFSTNSVITVPNMSPYATVTVIPLNAVNPLQVLAPTITVAGGLGNLSSITVAGLIGTTTIYEYTVVQPPFQPYFAQDQGLFTTGAPCVIAINKDLPVESGVTAGTAGIYTLQVQYSTRNFSKYPITKGVLYVVPIFSQYFTTYSGATSTVETAIMDEATFIKMDVLGDTSSYSQIYGTVKSKDASIVANGKQRILQNIATAMSKIAQTVTPSLPDKGDPGSGPSGKRFRERLTIA